MDGTKTTPTILKVVLVLALAVVLAKVRVLATIRVNVVWIDREECEGLVNE